MPIPRITKLELISLMEKLTVVYGYPNTPGNEGVISEALLNIWYEVLGDNSYSQVKNAVNEHIRTDDSFRVAFPLPGAIAKLIKPEDIYTEEERRAFIKVQEEREQKQEEERWNSLSAEQREEELKRKEESRQRIRQMLSKKGIEISE